jgi:penicillin-binding protein 2
MATVRIKDPWREKRLFEGRVVFAGAVIIVLTITLLAQLYKLQIVRHDYYDELSNGNNVRTEPIPAARGVILDRNGEIIATSRPAYQLELTPEDTPDIRMTLALLGSGCDPRSPRTKKKECYGEGLHLIRDEEFEGLASKIRVSRSFDHVPLRVSMPDEDVARFAVHQWEFRGVQLSTRQTRSYPNFGLAVHALGYVSSISEQDLEQIDHAAYNGTALIGKLGVEQAFEKQLHGINGSKQVLVNAQGRSVSASGPLGRSLKTDKGAIPGDDVFLSIDLKVQRAAEEGICGHPLDADKPCDHQGAVVAIDPSNGDILALASLPDFDPNLFAKGITGPEYRGLSNDPAIPLLNRAIRGAYPPGSTVKPMLALAGLTYHTIDPERRFTCTGQFHIPGSAKVMHEFHNEKHGTLTLDDAIIRSCDSYFYTAAENMHVERIDSFMSPFGYGRPTGIDIPGEKPGIMPSKDWKKKSFKRPVDQIWFPGETVNMGVGQGYLAVTPIQQAHYAGIMAMRGKVFRPRLVTATRDSSGKIHPIPPIYEGEIVPDQSYKDAADKAVPQKIAPEDWERIRNDMIGVTQRGTAAAPFQYCAPSVCATAKVQYPVGGKTGTAQVYTVQENDKYDSHNEALRDHSWFIAFAPADNPRIAVAVIEEHGGSGASAAAPIARKVLDAYLLGADGKLKPPPETPATTSSTPATAEAKPAEAAPASREKAAPVPVHATSPAQAPPALASQRG